MVHAPTVERWAPAATRATITLIARLGRQQTLTLDATRWQTSDKDVARITRDAEELGGCVSA